MGPVNPNADKVDGFDAAGTAQPGKLIALNDASELVVPRLRDANNASYYLDPASTSYLGALRADEIAAPIYYDRNNGAFYADPAGTSVFQGVDVRGSLLNGAATYVTIGDDLRANQFVDANNTGFYVDPAATSELNAVYARSYNVNSHQSNTGYSVFDSSSNDIDYGLRAANPDMSGVWVSGSGDDGIYVTSSGGDGMYIGTTGEFGIRLNNTDWSGYYVENTDASGVYVKNAGWGVYVESSTYYGVNARGSSAGGFFSDSDTGRYAYVGYGNYGVYSNGVIRGTSFTTSAMAGSKDTDTTIEYAALVGGETGTYYRGTARLQGGKATVELPEHFSLVTEEAGLTVQVTPRADCNGLFVAEVTPRQIVVKELQGGTSDARFDFIVYGVRAGYADYQVVRHSEVPPAPADDPEGAKTGE